MAKRFSRIVVGAGITNQGVVLAHQVTYEQPNPRVDAPTLGVVSGSPALWLNDIVESLIGLTLVTGHLLRAGLWRSVSPSSGSCHPCARCRITFVKETL